MGEKAQGHRNGKFWRMGGLFPGPIWREFQTSRILLIAQVCPQALRFEEKGQGMPVL